MKLNSICNCGPILGVGLICLGWSALPGLGQELKATGGDSSYVTNISDVVYGVHVFTSVGTTNFTPSETLGVEYLIVGGGGGGGGLTGGGGGAGGVVLGTRVLAAQEYPVVVGVGGTGGKGYLNEGDHGGTSGEASSIDGTVGYGGGR